MKTIKLTGKLKIFYYEQIKKMFKTFDKEIEIIEPDLTLCTTESEITKNFLNSYDIWIIHTEKEKQLLGFIFGKKFGKMYQISYLYIDPSIRRLGHASHLLQILIDFAISKGFKIFDLVCLVKNEKAMKLYEQWSFKPFSYYMMKKC